MVDPCGDFVGLISEAGDIEKECPEVCVGECPCSDFGEGGEFLCEELVESFGS